MQLHKRESRTCLMVNDFITVNIYSLKFFKMIFICKIVGDQEAAFKQHSEAMKIIEFSSRMLALKDNWIETLGASRTAILQRVDGLQKENRKLIKARCNKIMLSVSLNWRMKGKTNKCISKGLNTSNPCVHSSACAS